MNIQPGNSK